jgi:class 3 adenylate cyclase
METPSASPGRDPLLRRELPGPVLLITRAATLGVGLAMVAVIAHLIPRWVEARDREMAAFADTVPPGIVWIANVGAEALSIFAVLACLVVAGIILWRRSRDLLGIVVALAFLGIAPLLLDIAVTREIALGMGGPGDDWPVTRPLILMASTFALALPYLLPDGRVVPRWGMLMIVGQFVGIGYRAVSGYNPEGAALATAFVAVLLAGGAFIYRYRHSDAVGRQQMKWVALAGTIFLVAYALTGPPLLVAELRSGAAGLLYRVLSSALVSLAGAGLAVATTIAILRQGLLNIDLIINRAAVYAVLTAVLAGLFAIVAVVATRAFEAMSDARSDVVALVAVLPVGIAFVPLRSWLLHVADRFVSDRRVLTVLFVDIAGSTAHAVEIGDRAYRELLGHFRASVRQEIRRFGGREIDTAGDGFFATFESPGQAIRCALRIIDAVRPLGLEVRAGLHIGEVEAQGPHVTGIAVHTGARIASLASASEVLVSRTVRDLVSGSSIVLSDRGTHSLKGVPGDWQVYAAALG